MYIPFEFENGGTRVIHYTPETYEPKVWDKNRNTDESSNNSRGTRNTHFLRGKRHTKTNDKIEGKPVSEQELECFRDQGFTDIILTVSHLGNIIMDYFGDGSVISPVTGKLFGK